MPEPPRRKRFQIHLSTAIVLMFVAGIFIWINTHETKVKGPNKNSPLEIVTLRNGNKPELIVEWEGIIYSNRGWPFPVFQTSIRTMILEDGTSFIDGSPESNWRIKGVLWNLAVLVLILAIAGLFLERLIFRRESRKDA